MPKHLLPPPKGAKPLAGLPCHALLRANGGTLDAVVRMLYAAVEDAGGQSAGWGRDGRCRFTLGSVQALLNFSTGWAELIAGPNVKVPTQGRSPARALPGADLTMVEPDFEIDPNLKHAGYVWTINFLRESGDTRIYEINAAVRILQNIGQQFRWAVMQLFQDRALNLFVRTSATRGFEPVYRDAVRDCCLDWASLRLVLSDGVKPEQAFFTPAIGQESQATPGEGPVDGDVELCRRIGTSVMAAFPTRAWGAPDLIELMQELAPSMSEPDCRRVIAQLKSGLSKTSPWRSGGRPPALALRTAAWPILEQAGIIATKNDTLPDGADRSR